MKRTIESIIEEIRQIKYRAQDSLKHTRQYHNSFGCGYDTGMAETCIEILTAINGKPEEWHD